MGHLCNMHKTNACKILGKKHDESACGVNPKRENRGQL
jgi:hypothetical protein